MRSVYSEKDYDIGELDHGLGSRARRRKWRAPRIFGTTETMFSHPLISFLLIDNKACNIHPASTGH